MIKTASAVTTTVLGERGGLEFKELGSLLPNCQPKGAACAAASTGRSRWYGRQCLTIVCVLSFRRRGQDHCAAGAVCDSAGRKQGVHAQDDSRVRCLLLCCSCHAKPESACAGVQGFYYCEQPARHRNGRSKVDASALSLQRPPDSRAACASTLLAAPPPPTPPPPFTHPLPCSVVLAMVGFALYSYAQIQKLRQSGERACTAVCCRATCNCCRGIYSRCVRRSNRCAWAHLARLAASCITAQLTRRRPAHAQRRLEWSLWLMTTAEAARSCCL